MTTIEPKRRQDQPTTAHAVLNLCEELTSNFARGPVLMPIVVLQSDDPPMTPPPGSSTSYTRCTRMGGSAAKGSPVSPATRLPCPGHHWAAADRV